MYPAHTQLVAKCSSPSIGDQRATGCTGLMWPKFPFITMSASWRLMWQSSLICLSIGWLKHFTTAILNFINSTSPIWKSSLCLKSTFS